jgi:hypothetical protein
MTKSLAFRKLSRLLVFLDEIAAGKLARKGAAQAYLRKP